MRAFFHAVTDLQGWYDNNVSPPSSPSSNAHGGESSPSGPSGSATSPPTKRARHLQRPVDGNSYFETVTIVGPL